MSDTITTLPPAAHAAPPHQEQLDAALQVLSAHKQEWATLAVQHKLELLRQMLPLLETQAQAWVDAAVRGKQIEPSSPWVGEEWISGPWALAAGLNG